MKEIRLQNKVSGGPQSHILEGVTWEEVKTMNEQKTGDQVVLVGAASKGIIQREFQHNAMVYKSAYAKNPFDNVSEQELEEYKQYVERKQRGEPGLCLLLYCSFIRYLSQSLIRSTNKTRFICLYN